MLFHQLFLTLLSAVVISDEEKESAANLSSTGKSEPIAPISPTLKSSWSLWYDLQPKRGLQVDDYRKLLQKVGTFNTISGFWNTWNELFRNIPDHVCNFQVFKEGVEPIWEHPSNIHGGKWVITKGTESQVNDNIKDWLSLVLSMIAGSLGFEEDLCGAVLSIRSWGISITIWNRDCNNQKQVADISDKLKVLLGIEHVRYQPHQTSLQRNSSSTGVQRHASFQFPSHKNKQPQKSKQQQSNKKKVERAQSAPAVLGLDSSPKQQQQQQPTGKAKKNPRQRRRDKQLKEQASSTTNNNTNNAAKEQSNKPQRKGPLEDAPLTPSNPSPGSHDDATATTTKKSKQAKKRQSKKNQAKTVQFDIDTTLSESMDTSNSPSTSPAAGTGAVPDGVSHKLVGLVKPLTSMPIDRKLGISLLIGATLTAMYIL
jgi:translation initiation factor 4E